MCTHGVTLMLKSRHALGLALSTAYVHEDSTKLCAVIYLLGWGRAAGGAALPWAAAAGLQAVWPCFHEACITLAKFGLHHTHNSSETFQHEKTAVIKLLHCCFCMVGLLSCW